MIRANTSGPQRLGKGCGPEALGPGPRRGGGAPSAPRVPARRCPPPGPAHCLQPRQREECLVTAQFRPSCLAAYSPSSQETLDLTTRASPFYGEGPPVAV